MSRQNHVRRIALLCGASLLTVAATLPTGALAHSQTPAATDGATTVDEVVVTGIRAQLRSAQAIKKNSEVIVDSVTAVDIGALPDRSVSEALQRIPGVTLQRTNAARDPARLAAEGGGVFIRGLSWVRSETNGRDIFSASNGRGLSFEDVSADLLAGVDVYKNVAANMIEGGIAGTDQPAHPRPVRQRQAAAVGQHRLQLRRPVRKEFLVRQRPGDGPLADGHRRRSGCWRTSASRTSVTAPTRSRSTATIPSPWTPATPAPTVRER